jgi:hypothetical protein
VVMPMEERPIPAPQWGLGAQAPEMRQWEPLFQLGPVAKTVGLREFFFAKLEAGG